MELDDDVLRELMQTFRAEAVDYVKTINQSLLLMERVEINVERQDHIQAALRAAHTLKGAARAVNQLVIEELTHQMESVLQPGYEDTSILTADVCDVLYSVLDVIEQLIAGEEADALSTLSSLQDLLDGAHVEKSDEQTSDEEQPLEVVTKPLAPSSWADETIRVKTSKLDELMAQVGLLLAARIGSSERVRDTREIQQGLARWHKLWREIKLLLPQAQGPASQQISDMLYSFAAHMNDVQRHFDQFEQDMRQDARRLDMALGTLQDNVRQIRMVPFQTVSLILERAVRDAARVEKKEIAFIIKGEDVELDKQVLEALKDPLLHLLRNAVSHGVETPIKRAENGKAPQGHIELRVFQRGNEVQIIVEDDGAGFDIEGLRALSQRNGDPGRRDTSDWDTIDDVIASAFRPGVSTAPEITEISGRGVGLDVVRQHIESIRGRIQVNNHPGHGATITLIVPTSLAITRVLMVYVGSECYGIPLLAIEKILNPENIRLVSGRSLLEVDNAHIPLNALGAVLERPVPEAKLSDQFAVILTVAEKRVALLVSDVLTELELAVKPLAEPLMRVRNVIGTALLGSGEPIIILNPGDLIRSTINHTYQAPLVSHQEEVTERPCIEVLVVDDSITTRTLEKNILEMAGYHVTTAINGREALTLLDSQPFDIVISDVQMPHMDGIELVTAIRGHSKLHILPVILVTSLESQEDRQRGLLAGANAYIVKRGFNQEELLKTIQQFV